MTPETWLRRFAVKRIAALLMLVVAVGCANKNKMNSKAGVLDVGGSSVASTPAPTYTPPPQAAPLQPVAYEPVVSATPAPGAAGGTYIVKKNDTLYGIARAKYGDGKQWQKIAAANPGVSASSLKVGQTLVLP
jgi:nucleoid-associated protein YgaU